MVRWGSFGVVLLVLEAALAAAAGAANWQLVGPYGGLVSELARSVSNPDVVYAGVDGAGVYRSADGGATWHDLNSGLPAGQAFALAVDPTNASSVWMIHGISYPVGHVYHSRDGGNHWRNSESLGDAKALVAGPGVAYAVTDRGLRRSGDGGRSWQEQAGAGLEPFSSFDSLAVDSIDPQLLYATTSNTVSHGEYVSTDGGSSWRLSSSTLYLGKLRADPHVKGVVVGASSHGLMRSLDAGRTWNPVGPTNLDQFAGFSLGTGRPADLILVFSTVPTAVMVVDGRTGNTVRLPSDPADPHTTTVVSVDYGRAGSLLIGEFNGIRRTVDGGRSWSGASYLGGVATGPIAVRGRRSFLVGSMRTDDGGRHWSRYLSPYNVRALAVAPSRPDTVYAAVDALEGTLYRSTDGGRSWTPLSELPYTGSQPWSLVVDPQHPDTVYVASIYSDESGGLFRSVDGGTTWEQLPLTTYNVYQVALGPGKPGCLFAATDEGLQRSCDLGATWTLLFQPDWQVTGVTIAPSDGRWIYAVEATGNDNFQPQHLWRSKDGGEHFESSDFDGVATLSVAVDPRSPDTVYVGAAGGYSGDGLWRRRGDGAWEDLTMGLPGRAVSPVAIDLRGGPRLFVGDAGLRILALDDTAP